MNSINDILDQKADDLFTPPNSVISPESIDIGKIKDSIYKIKDQLDSLLRLLNGTAPANSTHNNPKTETILNGETVIEGVFNGEKMVGPDGKEYSIPPNYASKSKLVEGDMMKLTITNKGSFIFKQIGPTERRILIGELLLDPTIEQWSVLADGHNYKVLTASITFYKGKSGDQVAILIPKDSQSAWAAVDNILSK